MDGAKNFGVVLGLEDRRIYCLAILALLMLTPIALVSSLAHQYKVSEEDLKPKKVVVIEGDRALAYAFARIFAARGYMVIIKNDDSGKTEVLKVRQDTEKPRVEITNPANGSYLSGNVTLTIVAYDNTCLLYTSPSPRDRG